MNYQEILQQTWEKVEKLQGRGKVASYIPELAKVNPDQFGITLKLLSGETYHQNDYQTPFSIQSISKVYIAAIVFSLLGEKLWKRVGVEPSGTAFNSLVQLEYDKGIPRNPFINAGALVIVDILLSHFDNPVDEVLKFVRKLAGDDSIEIDEKTALSEMQQGFRNAAMANLIKDFGNIENNVDDILNAYFTICSIEMSTDQLSESFLVFANHGKLNNEKVLTVSQAKRLNAVMQTCGFYDESGEFSFTVGLPGKSGVGGGIVAIYPGEFSIAVWSPRLNSKGNSIMGMKALEHFTTLSGLSIF
jgi:glutaminase